jgi:dTDP-4-dehydrorhamnose reductase
LTGERHIVVRTSLLFGPSLIHRPVFFDQQVEALRRGKKCPLFVDEWRTPLSLSAAADAVLQIALSDQTGRLHLGGPDRLSRYEMGQVTARMLGLDGAALTMARQSDVAFPEPRPRDVSLDSTLWRSLFPTADWPTYAEAIRQFGL